MEPINDEISVLSNIIIGTNESIKSSIPIIFKKKLTYTPILRRKKGTILIK